MDSKRYNLRVQRAILRGLVSLAVGAAALVLLSAAQGGAFAGGNGEIAFTCGASICTINPDGTGRKPHPRDRDRSVLVGRRDRVRLHDRLGISVANDDGSLPTALGTGSVRRSRRSRSTSTVAFVKTGDIFTINSDSTGNEQPLTSAVATEADPAFSPDGSKIAFASNVNGTYDIWIVPISTGIPFEVTPAGGANERSPSWSPDGSKLVFTSAGELFTVAAAPSSTPADLHVPGADPAYSPDGTKIAYITGGNLAVVSANGTGTQTIDSSGADAQPDWQEAASGTGPPRNLSYPTINLASGDAQPVLGHFLTASVGTWDGAFSITYQYQWKRCDAGDPLNGTCVNIAGATSSFYTPATADVGMRFSFRTKSALFF
jgi:hypothetical protein